MNGGTATKIRLKVGDRVHRRAGEEMPDKQIDPRILEAAKDDGLLRRMIASGAPLTREKWIRMNWLGHPPKPRTSEHEAEVPPPFQLMPSDGG